MPMRVNRHCRRSASPAVMASLGRLPSLLLRGSRRRRAWPLVASAMAAVAQRLTSEALMVTCRRHLPTCMTSGKSMPTGTLSSRNLPLESVSAVAMGRPDTEAEQVSHEAPVAMLASGASGT